MSSATTCSAALRPSSYASAAETTWLRTGTCSTGKPSVLRIDIRSAPVLAAGIHTTEQHKSVIPIQTGSITPFSATNHVASTANVFARARNTINQRTGHHEVQHILLRVLAKPIVHEADAAHIRVHHKSSKRPQYLVPVRRPHVLSHGGSITSGTSTVHMQHTHGRVIKFPACRGQWETRGLDTVTKQRIVAQFPPCVGQVAQSYTQDMGHALENQHLKIALGTACVCARSTHKPIPIVFL